jgi:hypothetical protein
VADVSKETEVAAHIITPDVPQSAVLIDSASKVGDVEEQQHEPVDSPVRSPLHDILLSKGISIDSWNNAPDAPSMELFSQGSQDYNNCSNIPDTLSSKPSTPGPDDVAAMSCVEKPKSISMFTFLLMSFFLLFFCCPIFFSCM